MIKGIIFDFDGTLFDSMGIWVDAGGLYLQSVGKTAEDGLWDKIKDMTMHQAAVYLKETYDLPQTEEKIVDGVSRLIRDFYFYEAMPKDNVVDALCAFKEKGIKMCIATATDRCQIEAALKRCGMFEYFAMKAPGTGRADGHDCLQSDAPQSEAGDLNYIFTCSEVGHGKDEPYIFETCRKALGTEKSETAVFEDAYYAAKTARDAGFFLVGVYDSHEKRTEEIKKIADVYVRNFSELEGEDILQ